MVTPVASGPEFRVNTHTPDAQIDSAITSLPGGGFVVVWQSRLQDGSEYGVYGQRYDAAGNAVGAEFRVNTQTVGSQFNVAVDALEGGGFVVTWVSTTPVGLGLVVRGQRYDAAGAPAGGEFRVDTSGEVQFSHAVTGLADGGFLASWQSSSLDLLGQRFSADGARVGPEFIVNSILTGNQTDVALAGLPNGGFVATWTTFGPGSGREVFARIFDAIGAPTGPDIRVNTTAFAEQPTVTALTDGSFVVAWTGSGAVRAQQFLPSGSPVGSELLVSTAGAAQPSLTSLPDGGFLVTWSGSGDGSGFGIFGRRYDDDGVPVGGEFRVNSVVQADQLESDVTTLSGGGVVASWTSYAGDSAGQIQAQRFTVPAAPDGGGGDPPIGSRFTISAPAAAAEGTGGTTAFTFTVTRNADATGTALVDWFVPTWNAPGPNSSDFTGTTSGTLYFAPGENSKTIQVNVVGDAVREPDETLTVQLSNARGGAINVDRASTTILNDDGDTPPAARLSWGHAATGVSHPEGDTGTTAFTFVVNRSGDTGGTTTVDWRLGFPGNTPASAQDFTGPISGTLTFAPGELSREIVLQVTGEQLQEADENFEVILSNSPGATLPAPLPGRILNDDGAPPTARLSIAGPAPQAEGTGGTTAFDFTVTRSGDTSALTQVDYFLLGDTNAQDFSGSTTGTLSFLAGETSKTIRINVAGDANVELDESFFVGLSNARGGVIETQRANTIILNDDSTTPPAAQLSWGTSSQGLSQNEGDSGTTTFTYVLNRSGDTSGVTTVDWLVRPGTASAGDFAGPLSGSLTFAAGELSKQIVVQVASDTAVESDETFQVELSNAPGATLPPPIPGRILNDDGGGPGPSTVSIAGPGALAEGTGANTFFDFNVTRSGDTSGRTLVDYFLLGDTNAQDFTGRTTGTLYFEVGETSKVIRIEVVGDSVAEPDESFVIGLSNPRGGVLGASQAPARILDDDGWVMG